MKRDSIRRPAKLKAAKVKPMRCNVVTIDKAENGYIASVNGSSYKPDYVFETDVALFKFLRKHFCEGYK